MIDRQRYSHAHALWQLRKVLICLGLGVMLWVGLPLQAQAATQEFTIFAAGVDDNTDRATQLAMEYARKRALYLAAQKLGAKDPAAAAAAIKPEDVAQIIRGVTVLQTKRDGNKFYAQVQVSLNDLPLRKALGMGDPETSAAVVSNDQSTMRSVLVLPALVLPKKTLVWDKDNALREPLSSELLRAAHGTIMMPAGDLADLRLIDGENVAKVKTSELQPMFDAYGTDEIIIAIYTPGTLQTEEPDKVLLRRLNNFDPHDEALEIRPASADDSAEMRTQRVAQAIAAATVQIASSTAQTMQQKLDTAAKIPVHFIYTIPRELATMEDAIRQGPGVMQLELPAIERDNVTGTIYLNGDKTALRKALAAKGVVTRDQGDAWTVSLR